MKALLDTGALLDKSESKHLACVRWFEQYSGVLLTTEAVLTSSYRFFETGYLLSKQAIEWYRDKYAPNPSDWKNPLVSPLQADDLSRLPPATLINAEIDVLVDEGRLYAEKLSPQTFGDFDIVHPLSGVAFSQFREGVGVVFGS
jgi:hypothetical protein